MLDRLVAVVVHVLEVACRERGRDHEGWRRLDRHGRQLGADRRAHAGRQKGNVSSSSILVNASSTGMPIDTVAGSASMSSATIRTPSSSSTSATTNGKVLPGTGGAWCTTKL